MALTQAQRAQMDEILRKTTGTTATLTPEIRAKMDAIVQHQEAGRLQTTQTPAQVAEEPGPVKGFIQGLAQTFLRPATNVLNVGEGVADLTKAALTKDQAEKQRLIVEANKASTKTRDYGYFGKAAPVGGAPTTGNVAQDIFQGTKDIIGSGLDVGSYVAPGAEAFGLGKEALLQGGKQLLKQGVKQTAIATGKAGALQGGISSFGQAIQKPDASLGQVAAQTLQGTGMGALGGAVLGGTGAVVGKIASPVSKLLKPGGIVASRAEGAVGHNLSGLQHLENNNKPLQRIVQKAKAQGFDVKNDIAKNINLEGAINREGSISTRGEGEALSQIDDFLSHGENGQGGPETVVRAVLDREGKTVNLKDVEQALLKNINSSGLEGASLDAAHSKISAEIRGLLRRADTEGNISLSKLQDAKISKYKTLDFLNEGSKIADKDIAATYRKLIEKHTASADVKALNKELARIYAMRDFLDTLHGKKVKGGRLGKYFAKVVGGMAGMHVGGPIGSFAGSEIAGHIQGMLMKNTFKGIAGEGLQNSQLMKDALKLAATPKEVPQQNLSRLALPAPAIIPPLPKDTSGAIYSQAEIRAQLAARGWKGLEPKEVPKPQTKAVKGLLGKLQAQAKKRLISSDEKFNYKIYADSLAEQGLEEKATIAGRNDDWREVMKTIRNSPDFKKEGSITNALSGGSVMKKNGKKIVVPADKVKEFIAKGYTVKDTLEGISHATGFESADDYLTFITELYDQDKMIDRSPIQKKAHNYLLENDPEYARREKRLEEFRQREADEKARISSAL